MIRGRLTRNTIKGLISNGIWEEKPEKIKELVFHHFSNHFREPIASRLSFSCKRFKKLSPSQVTSLDSTFTESEVKTAVWLCGDSKAAEPDGFTFAFIKAYWEAIKVDVMNFMWEFATSGKIVKGGNSTFLILIPKKSNPLSLDDYRPISLVGAQYKILAKVLSERLKPVMADFISDNQTAFVGGRQILDGVLMANEAVNWAHVMKKKLLLLKVDFTKAFDCINWDFLEACMRKMNFSTTWRMWIKGCLNSATISVLVNGSSTAEFPMQRDLRQGDPLSPFLFLLLWKLYQLCCQKPVAWGCIGVFRLEIISWNDPIFSLRMIPCFLASGRFITL